MFPFPTSASPRLGTGRLSPGPQPRPGGARQWGAGWWQTLTSAVVWRPRLCWSRCHLVQMTFVLSVKETPRLHVFAHKPPPRVRAISAVFQLGPPAGGAPLPPPRPPDCRRRPGIQRQPRRYCQTHRVGLAADARGAESPAAPPGQGGEHAPRRRRCHLWAPSGTVRDVAPALWCHPHLGALLSRVRASGVSFKTG